MKTLALSVRQRLVAVALIRQERTKDGDELDLLFDLKRKVQLSDDEKAQYMTEIGPTPRNPDGATLLDWAAIDKADEKPFEFEKAEWRKFSKIMLDCPTLTVDDKELWFDALKAKIKVVDRGE